MGTVRQQLREILTGARGKTALELSGLVHQSERQVLEHLQHLRKTLDREGTPLRIDPAHCHGCGHRFDTRDKLGRPSRCPECRSERIEAARFSIDDDDDDDA